MDERIYELEIDMLQPNPLQPRGLITPDSLIELSESVKTHGILEPLVVAKTPAGYQIIAGERRWRASRLAGLKKVPVIIKETSPQGMLEMAIVENVQRIDLNPLERAQAYQRLMDEFDLTNGEISSKVSKSPAYISNTIKLLTLPDAIKDALMSGATTEGHARSLASLEEPHMIVAAYKEVLKKSLSVRATEEMVRRLRAKAGIVPKSQAALNTMHIISDELDKVRDELNELFSHKIDKSSVKCVQTGKKLKIELILEGIPDKTTPLLNDIHQAITGYFKLQEETN